MSVARFSSLRTCLLLFISYHWTNCIFVGGADISSSGDWASALKGAAPGEEIVFAPGRYLGGCGLVIDKNLSLRSRAGAEETVIDCEGMDRHFVVSGASLTIQGVGLLNGMANGTKN
eukprot:140331-Rhodomonas_salina.1